MTASASFADRLRAERRAAGLSRADVKSGPTHPATLADWEQGWRLPPARKARELADVLGLDGEQREAFLAARFARQHAEIAHPTSWGHLLRAYRERAGLTRQELGQRLGLPIWQIERCEVWHDLPPPETLPQLIQVLREALDADQPGGFDAERFQKLYETAAATRGNGTVRASRR